MIYVVDVKLYYECDCGCGGIIPYHSVENVCSKKPLDKDEIFERALAEAIKDATYIYGLTEYYLQHSKANLINFLAEEDDE